MRHQQLIANLGLLLVLGASVAAEQGGLIRREESPQPGREIGRSAVRFSETWRPRGASGDTRVIGTVIDIRYVPVSAARVQLRNLDTGDAEQETDSNALGEYDFAILNPGTYVVEMIMVEGYVVAVSNAGSVSRFETLQTVIQLPGRWDAIRRGLLPSRTALAFVGMSSQTTMTATTVSIAVDRNIPPVDAGEPVSPQQ